MHVVMSYWRTKGFLHLSPFDRWDQIIPWGGGAGWEGLPSGG